ncbi:hypothetical protein HAX54_000708 [Datura stramonium]|uniref:Uncharacterized protein n=1 Tax=Datura stramonium TaxID=4076 RepID=A0ABS8WSN3_DATST|nr:hypothetical protein [Datura stramonium]
MAPKANKGKGVASSSHRNKRSRMGQVTPNEDASMPPQPPKRYSSVGSWRKKEIDVIKTKDPDGIHGPVPSISERNALIDNVLSHLYGMQTLQVGPIFEEPLGNDDVTDEEQARVDSELEFDNDGDDFEMGEAAFAPIDDED